MTSIQSLIELLRADSELFVVSLAIWATVILGITWGAVAWSRRSSPAVRYCLWQFALLGLLVVPVLFVCLPGVPLGISLVPAEPQAPESLGVFPLATGALELVSSIEPASPEATDAVDYDIDSGSLRDADATATAPPASVTVSPPSASSPAIASAASAAAARAWPWSRSAMFLTVWAGGAALNVLWLVYAGVLVQKLLRAARPVKETRFQRVLDDLRHRYGLERRVRLLQIDRVHSPLVVGAFRPAILLPSSCSQWPAERIWMVLSHELAHVQRRDLFWQLLGRLSAAIYWFHPLVWLAVKHMRLEREQACDDRVLLAGIEPVDYATGLVECAAALSGRPLNLTLGISMAQRSQLEMRIRSILDASLKRGPVSAGVRRGIVCGTTCLVLALGVLRPFSPLSSGAADSQPPAAEPLVSQPEQPQPTAAQPAAVESAPAPAPPAAAPAPATPAVLTSAVEPASTTSVVAPPAGQSTVFLSGTPAPVSVSPGELWSACFSGNGKTLAACGGGEWNNQGAGWARIWDLQTSKEIASYTSPRGVISISLSPDGRRVAWSGWNNTVSLNEVGGRELQTHVFKRFPRLAFSPDGYLLVAGDEKKEMIAVDGLTGKRLDGFQGDNLECFWVGFSPDGSLMGISGGPAVPNDMPSDKLQLAVWDVATRRQVFKATGHPNRVFQACLSPDNKTFAAACNDLIWLWDIETGTLREQVKTPHHFIRRLAYSPDGSLLASSGSADGAVVLWNTSTWQPTATLRGHEGRVRALDFTSDGKTLVSGGVDQAILLWDVASQTQKSKLQSPVARPDLSSPQFLAVAYAPDGNHLAAAGDDGRVSVYDLTTGKVIHAWQAHADTVAALAYSPDGQVLASGGYDKLVQLWKPASGEAIRTISGHQGWVVSLAFSHDGRTLASGSYDRSIMLWNPADGSQHGALAGHTATVRSLAFARDDSLLASGSSDRKVKLWNVATGQEQATLEGHEGAVRSVAFSPDDRTLASGGEDRLIKLWNVETHALRGTLRGHDDMVSAVAFAGSTLVSASWDRSIRTWDVDAAESRGKLDAGGDAVIAIAVAPDGKQLLSAGANGTFKLWKAAQGEARPTASFGPYGNVMSAAFSPDGALVAVGASGNSEISNLYVLDRVTSTEKFHVELPAHLRSVAYSPRGDLLALGFSPGDLMLVEAATGSTVGTFHEHGEGFNKVAFSGDGKLLATASSDNFVRIYDTERRELMTTLKGHKGAVLSLAFSPDQTQLLSSCQDGTAIVWNLATGERRYSLPGQSAPMQSVAWSPDGRTLATGGRRGECKLWYAETGLPLRTFIVTQSTVFDISFAPDSQCLATASADNLIRLCDVSTGKTVLTYPAHAGAASCARFSPDGKLLLSAGADGLAKVWAVAEVEAK